MDMPSGAHLQQLRLFVEALKKNPDWLHHPNLDFLSDYLINELGVKLPPPFKNTAGSRQTSESDANKKDESMPDVDDEDSSHVSEIGSDVEELEESDFEEVHIDGVIDADDVNVNSLTMGSTTDASEELSDEKQEAFSAKRSEGMAALGDGRLDDAIQLFSDAIDINPKSAVVFAKRGVALVRLQRPVAAIRDFTRALELNPDSALAYKWRGRAYRLRGDVLAAAKDLRTACKIDFDEQSDEWLKEVAPLAAKIEEHSRKVERKREEKQDKQRRERLRRAREANARATKNAAAASGKPGGAGGLGDLGDLLGDPDLMAALSDPEMSKAFADVSQNPANLSKYQNNPKVMSFVMKMMGKMGGAGGAANMFGAAGAQASAAKCGAAPEAEAGATNGTANHDGPSVNGGSHGPSPTTATSFPKAPSATDDLD